MTSTSESEHGPAAGPAAAAAPQPGGPARTRRVAFQLQVRTELLEEYRRRHAEVWPSMLRAIEASGRRNYSLFLGEDGLLIGYYEVDDDQAAQAALAADPRTAPWEDSMQRFFQLLDDRADQSAVRLTEVFHLEDQLAALTAPTPESRKS